MEVLAHERALLESAGYEIDQYTLAATDDLPYSAMRAGAKAVWNRDAAHEVDRRISQFRPDVVHVHTPFPLMSPTVFRVAHKRRVPTVTTLHSYRWSCVAGTCFRDDRICEDCVGTRLKLSGVRHRCYHDSLAASSALTISLVLHRGLGTLHECVDRWLTLTGFAKRLLVRDGIPAGKIEVKANSVPDHGVGVGPQAGDRFVLFAGRLLDIKGVDTLLDAWRQISGRNLRLVIAGDGPMRPQVEALAADEPAVDYLGWLAEDELTSLMGRAEAVVVPSRWYEGLPLVILRSLSVGTPVLAADLENFCEDLMADGAGVTFAVGDSASLAAQLQHIGARPSSMLTMRDAARRSYERRYAPEVDLKRLEGVYDRLTYARSF